MIKSIFITGFFSQPNKKKMTKWCILFVFLVFVGTSALGPLSLPTLPYSYDALKPYISEEMMRVHHLGHHATYTRNLNEALSKVSEGPVAMYSLSELMQHLNELPGRHCDIKSDICLSSNFFVSSGSKGAGCF